jgi:predicted ATPase
LALYDPKRHESHTAVYGHDPGVACRTFGAVALWLLGSPDRAVHESGEAVRLSHELAQPSTQALALHFAAMLRQLRREPGPTRMLAELSGAIAADQGFSFWHAGGAVLRGWATAAAGDPAGVGLVREGLAAWQATGSLTYQTYYLALLAEVLRNHGQVEEASRLLDEALVIADRTDERLFEAELHRLRGEVLSTAGRVASTEIEVCFRKALDVARRQGARALELRAALSLCRLCQNGSRHDEARLLLAEVYDRFAEGFSTPDLKEAKGLLDTLA